MPRNRPPAALAPDDPRHGTANAYNNLYCRCAACRRSWAEYITAYSHRTGRCRPRAVYVAESVKPDEDVPHGTPARYKRGCRCAACRAHQAALKRDWRRRAGRM
jgi:hypothetical protein